MRIVYMHHAERKIGENHSDPVLKQLEDITEHGIDEAKIISEKYKNNNQHVVAIYTSPYIRCVHTAEIINKYLNVPIIEESRFNEMSKGETWEQLLERNMKAIDDIVNKYDNDDSIICITSGINLSAFICYFYGIKPSNEVNWSQAAGISPINFKVSKKQGKYDID